MKLIIHNDDLGLTYGFTEAIKDAHSQGLTTSTSIRTNGYAYQYALQLLKGPLKKIGLGLHVNLTQGQPHTKGLTGSSENYCYNFLHYFLRLKVGDRQLLKTIEKEVEAQFKIALERDKLRLDHVSGHDHIHMIPPIFEIIAKVSRKYKLTRVRVVNENLYSTGSVKEDLKPLINSNLLKLAVIKSSLPQISKLLTKYKLKTTSAFYGLLHTNNMNSTTTKAAIEEALKRNKKTAELNFHPSFPRHPKDKKYLDRVIAWYANLPQRKTELETLLDQNLKDFIAENKIRLITYREI